MPNQAMASTTASEAPAVTPSRPGSPSGLRVCPCMSAPATPSARPTSSPSAVRGTRSRRTITAASVDGSPSTRERQTSPRPIERVPTAMLASAATMTRTSRSARPRSRRERVPTATVTSHSLGRANLVRLTLLTAAQPGGPGRGSRPRFAATIRVVESVGDDGIRGREAVPVSVRTGVVLDDVSRAIIEQLQQDGRRPYARIAEAVGLSEAAVRQRVQRLLDAGVVQIVGVTDPMQVGFARQAMVGIRTRGDTRKVADAFAAFDEVDYVVVTAGSFDILVEIVCEDDDRLLETVSRLRDVEGVESTETFVYLGLAKQTYAWGTRGPQGATSSDAGL